MWQAVPFVAFSVQAELSTIPSELYEAARLDGASAWQLFRSVTVPMLRSIFMVLAFLSFIWDFKVFTQVWAVRQGGPNRSTVTLPVYIYEQGISASHFGIGAAGSVVMVAILAGLLAYYIRHMLKTESL